jgi:hypothetical protein
MFLVTFLILNYCGDKVPIVTLPGFVGFWIVFFVALFLVGA